jgi:hypothetical protein
MREVTGQSISSLIVELLEVSMPSLDRMFESFRMIKQAELEDRNRFALQLVRAQQDLEPLISQAFSTWDSACQIIDQVAAVAPPAPPDGAPAPQPAPAAPQPGPPFTNRGGTKGGGPRQGAAKSGRVGGKDHEA